MPNELVTKTKTMTVPNSGTTSNAVEVEDLVIYGIDVPALTATTFKIQGSVDEGATFRDLYDEFGNQVLFYPNTFLSGTGAFHISAAACRHLIGCSHIQAVCGSAQGSARAITLYFRNTR